MKYIVLHILFIACVISANGQNIKKGYKNLEKKEYDKALDAFKKDLSDNPDNLGANFGMALILADDQSPFFDIIDAWQYIERIEDKIGDLSQEDIEVLSEYFLNTEIRKTSRPVKKKVEIAIEAIEARLIKYIREENNLDAVYELLDRYPNFRHYDNVIHIRNQFEYRKYEKMNTMEAYEEFIVKFPDAAQVNKAIRSRNKLAYDNAKSHNTVSAYNEYITAYPQSDYLQSVIKLRNAAAFADAKRINTLEAYESFIRNYPDALEVSEAKTKQQDFLYQQAKRVNSLQAFNEFIEKYPDGQYFVDIFNLKAAELGGQFLRENNFTSSDILWARGFDNNGRLESGGAISATSGGDYILACNTRDNDTAYADTWILKIDGNGKMLWNKTVGQEFEDSVGHILIDSKGDIIVLGYTYLSADSASKMGWMFKLGSDGKKLWNKNLGKIKINTCAIDAYDRIIIGGSTEQDSLGSRYTITVFNKDAQRVAERRYSSFGEFNDMLITTEGDIFFCGTHWVILMDEKRYIKWDDSIDPIYTGTHCSFATGNEFYTAGYNDMKIFYQAYSSDGKKLWHQGYDKSDSSQVIIDIAAISPGNLVVLEQKNTGGKIKLFSSEGSVLQIKDLFPPIHTEAVIPDKTGAMLVFSNGDLVVIRYSQLNTL